MSLSNMCFNETNEDFKHEPTHRKSGTDSRRFPITSPLETMAAACQGEEAEYFIKRFADLAEQIESMPVTYEQEGKGDLAIVHLHYFLGYSDWYITEKDVDGGVQQAYGYVVLNGDEQNAECGYISIEEITRCGVELDLFFTPCSLADVKAERTVRKTAI